MTITASSSSSSRSSVIEPKKPKPVSVSDMNTVELRSTTEPTNPGLTHQGAAALANLNSKSQSNKEEVDNIFLSSHSSDQNSQQLELEPKAPEISSSDNLQPDKELAANFANPEGHTGYNTAFDHQEFENEWERVMGYKVPGPIEDSNSEDPWDTTSIARVRIGLGLGAISLGAIGITEALLERCGTYDLIGHEGIVAAGSSSIGILGSLAFARPVDIKDFISLGSAVLCCILSTAAAAGGEIAQDEGPQINLYDSAFIFSALSLIIQTNFLCRPRL